MDPVLADAVVVGKVCDGAGRTAPMLSLTVGKGHDSVGLMIVFEQVEKLDAVLEALRAVRSTCFGAVGDGS